MSWRGARGVGMMSLQLERATAELKGVFGAAGLGQLGHYLGGHLD
jgi:hypothetical protein